MAAVRFNKNTDFFTTLRQRVDQHFQQNNKQITGDFKLYLKSGILFTVLIATYIVLAFFTPASVWLSVLLCVLLGGTFAAIGFNVMHDGSHGSYSKNPTLNKFMALALNLLGGNAYIWNLKHNINHHSFTNIEGMDDDIDIRPFIRVNEHQPKYWFHRFQHIYGIFLYGLTYLFWVFWQDFKKYFLSRVSLHTPMRKMKLVDHFNFWISKVLHIIVFLIIPMLTVGVGETLIGYGIASFAAGIVIAIVFQLAHIVEDASFHAPDNKVTNIESEWAVHQIKTTANFATRSKTISWLVGGLNFQIEHHLFPKISHVHYPAVSKIVRQTCQEFNIAYIEFPTLMQAVVSHFKHLKAQGVS